jgi:predicted  nucleic acid-binding Zn-ribbon protein
MTTAPIIQIVSLHRRPSLWVFCLTFLALAIVIFTLPKRATVRSSIEIGSAAIGDKQEAFEPPEQVARRIPSVYGPAALLAMAKKGTSPLTLGALQNPSIESIGRSVVMISTIDPSLENEAKEFQGITADLVIKELAPRARVLREGIATRISLAKRASDNLEQQIKADASEIERISALGDVLRGQIENLRANLATLYRRAGLAQQPDESSTLEAKIRELQDQISAQTTLIGSLTLERSRLTHEFAAARRQYEAQARAIADAQFEQNSFNETQISLPPSLMPAPTPSRRLSLLLVAFAISVLAGFGTVVLLYNFTARRI